MLASINGEVQGCSHIIGMTDVAVIKVMDDASRQRGPELEEAGRVQEAVMESIEDISWRLAE